MGGRGRQGAHATTAPAAPACLQFTLPVTANYGSMDPTLLRPLWQAQQGQEVEPQPGDQQRPRRVELPPQLADRALVWHRGADVVSRGRLPGWWLCSAYVHLSALRHAEHILLATLKKNLVWCTSRIVRMLCLLCTLCCPAGPRQHPRLGPETRLTAQLLAAAAAVGRARLAAGAGACNLREE